MSIAPAESISPAQQREHRPSTPVESGLGHHSRRRPALDGIRALAVTAVAIYHFGGGAESWLPGGFLGVDVFFVLSGYLITGLLLTEYSRHGKIDLLGFWVRRLRRLTPALLLMLAVVVGWIWWVSQPDSYPQRRSDVFWTVGYLANWHLIDTSETYFAAYGSASPLRHAWSLAIEEQFYLVWPTLLLALMWAGRRALKGRPLRVPTLGRLDGGRLLVMVGALVGAGFSAAWLAMTFDPISPSDAYYSTQGRVQELFVGVLLAIVLPRLQQLGRARRAGRPQQAGPLRPPGRRMGMLLTVGAGVGLFVLLVAILRLPDDAPFYYRGGALCVSLAVAALIAGVEIRPGGALARVFSIGPAVALGRISYGVYLWHWPLVVALPVDAGMPIREQVVRQSLRVVITLAAATASYYLVEQPILRSRRVLRSPRRVIVAAVAASALVIGITIPATALPGTLAHQLSVTSDSACPGERDDFLVVCTQPQGVDSKAHPPDVALLGDSTARALGPGLDDWAKMSGATWVQAAWKRCTPIEVMVVPSNLTEPDLAADTCYAQASMLIRKMLATYRPRTVVIAEYWDSVQPLLVNGSRLLAGTAAHDDALLLGYQRLVDMITEYGGQTVFLELPPPGASIGKQFATGRPAANARPPVSGGGRYVDSYNAILKQVANNRPGQASTVSLTDVICPGGNCPAVSGDTLLRTDGLHYSRKFSRRLGPILMQRIGVES